MQKLLIESRVLSTPSRDHLAAWLVASTTGTTRLRAGLPSSWRIGDKTGTGDNGAANDIAICWPSNRAPILIASYFTDSRASDADRSAALAEVGRIAAAAFALHAALFFRHSAFSRGAFASYGHCRCLVAQSFALFLRSSAAFASQSLGSAAASGFSADCSGTGFSLCAFRLPHARRLTIGSLPL